MGKLGFLRDTLGFATLGSIQQGLVLGECGVLVPQVFLVRKITPPDSNHLYAMKVLKKATLKGKGDSSCPALPLCEHWEMSQQSLLALGWAG